MRDIYLSEPGEMGLFSIFQNADLPREWTAGEPDLEIKEEFGALDSIWRYYWLGDLPESAEENPGAFEDAMMRRALTALQRKGVYLVAFGSPYSQRGEWLDYDLHEVTAVAEEVIERVNDADGEFAFLQADSAEGAHERIEDYLTFLNAEADDEDDECLDDAA